MIHYQPDHIHLLASDVMGVAEWYRDKLGAEIVLSKQSDGQSRVDLKIGDLQIYMSDGEVMKKWLGGELGPARTKAHLGLDHFGLSVDDVDAAIADLELKRSEEHTSELQSLMRTSYTVFCLNKKKTNK